MSLLSRRTMLKTGLAAMPAMALQSAPSFGQTCSAPQMCAATPSVLRQIATGCHAPDTEWPGVPSVLSRSPHFNRSGLTQHTLRIAVPNCYIGTALPKSRKTWQAEIEYPLNNLTTVTWNGNAEVTGTIAGDPTVQLSMISDEITLSQPIPDNALFWVRLSQTDRTGALRLLCQVIGNLWLSASNPNMQRSFNQALGETNCPADASLIKNPVIQDPTYGIWAFTDGGGHSQANSATRWASVRPMAILGQSRKPAFSLWGDSRVVGIGDTFDGVCDDRGEVERSIGPAYASINLAISGQALADVSTILADPQFTQLAPHVALGRYTTHLIEDLGGADCINYAHPLSGPPFTTSQATSNIIANKLSLWNSWLQTGNPLSAASTLTMPPHPDAASNSNIMTVVEVLRTGKDLNNNPLPVRVLDVASIVANLIVTDVNDPSSNQYVWSCSDYYVQCDYVHESQAGCLAIAESGIIDPYALTR